MPRWPKYNYIGERGQFFVISIVIVAISVMGIVSILEVYDEIRLTDFHMYQEDGVSTSIRQSIDRTVADSECGEDGYPRKRDLKELKEVAERGMRFRTAHLDITYHEYCDAEHRTTASIFLTSPGFFLNDSFQVGPEEYELQVMKGVDEGQIFVNGAPVDSGYTEVFGVGEEVSLFFEADEGYSFDFWSVDGVEYEEKDIVIGMDSDKTAKVHLEEMYELYVDVEGGGNVEGQDGEDMSGLNSYPPDEEVYLSAESEEGSYFDEWSGDVPDGEEGNEEITVVMDDDKDVEAMFEEYATLSIPEIEGGGSVEVDGGSVEAGFEEDYEQGTSVELSADPEDGWEFFEWQGDVEEVEDTEEMNTEVEMNGNYDITPVFVEETYTLFIDSEDGGSVYEPGEGEFSNRAEGEEVELGAFPSLDHTFDGWAGDTENIEDPDSAGTYITMEDDYSITATFEEEDCQGFGEDCESDADCCSGLVCTGGTCGIDYEPP